MVTALPYEEGDVCYFIVWFLSGNPATVKTEKGIKIWHLCGLFSRPASFLKYMHLNSPSNQLLERERKDSSGKHPRAAAFLVAMMHPE